jgi:hypothetical protein
VHLSVRQEIVTRDSSSDIRTDEVLCAKWTSWARARVRFPIHGLVQASLSSLLFIPFLFLFSARLREFIENSKK